MELIEYVWACDVADAESQPTQAGVLSVVDASACHLQAMVAPQSPSRLSSSIR